MTISVITENLGLVNYLTNSSSLIVVNHYINLVSQYEKFINDLNKVDVFLLVDYADLAQNLSKIINCISSGNNYLLKVGEIVVITYKDYKLSPTMNAEYRFSAFIEFLAKSHYKVRLVQLESIDFHSIYESVVKESTLSDNKISVYSKYKVDKSSGGINLVPKKSKLSIKPDILSEFNVLIEQDRNVASAMSGDTLTIPPHLNSIERVNKDYLKIDTINKLSPPLFIISGLKYSGKTTFVLKLLNEFKSLGFSALVVEAQGFTDYSKLQRINKSDYSVLKGSDIFKSVDNNSVIVELYHRAYTSNFLDSLKNLFLNKIAIICEVNIFDINNYYISYTENRSIYIVIEYDFTKVRDLTLTLKDLNIDLNIIINNRNDSSIEDNLDNIRQTLKECLPNVKHIDLITNISSIVTNMGVC